MTWNVINIVRRWWNRPYDHEWDWEHPDFIVPSAEATMTFPGLTPEQKVRLNARLEELSRVVDD